MEESLKQLSMYEELSGEALQEAAAREAAAFELNGPALAFLGDAVYGLLVREYCIGAEGSRRADKLHKHAAELVNAAAQSEAAGILDAFFTEREKAVFHRGRNAHTVTHARHQSIADYRRATGLEAVFGYLYLSGQHQRMRELFRRLV